MPETVTIESLVKEIELLQTKLGSEFASKSDLMALTKKLTDFQTLKNANERKLTAHRLFETQANFDIVAGHIGQALLDAGKVTKEMAESRNDRQKAAKFWMERAAGLNSTDTGVGLEFLPTVIDPIVSKLVNTYGVARRICRVRTGVQGTIQVKRRLTRVAVGGMPSGRPDDDAPLVNSTYDGVSLTTHQVTAITTIEEYLIYNSVVNVVEEAVSDLAEAAANFDDQVLFVGTGTNQFLGFTGIKTSSVSGLGETQLDVSNGDAMSFDTLLGLQTKVHPSVIRRPNARYCMHPYTFAYLQTLKASTSGVYHYDISKNNFVVGGYPLDFVVVMDPYAATATTVPVIFGDFERAVTIGLGREMSMRVLTELYADHNEIGLRLTYDEGYAFVQPSTIARVKWVA